MTPRFISVGTIILGVIFALLTINLPPPAREGTPGPAYFPRLAACGLIIFGFIQLLKSALSQKGSVSSPFLKLNPRVLNTILLTASIPAFLEFFGFILTCLGGSFVFLKILRVPFLIALGISLMITFLIYFSFHYALQVQFPKGILN